MGCPTGRMDSRPPRDTDAARSSPSPATTPVSFADLDEAHARLVVDAWQHRTAELMTRPGIEQVFCFENRGEEIGVTLTHPHGQIYGYPYLTPRTAAMLRRATAHRAEHGTNLFARILGRRDPRRHTDRHRATTLSPPSYPFAARWPVEVHIYPNRFVRNLTDLDDAEIDSFARIYRDVLRSASTGCTTPRCPTCRRCTSTPMTTHNVRGTSTSSCSRHDAAPPN